jgi:hypothetical protein
MKEREPNGESLSSLKMKRSFYQRLFESVLDDIKDLISEFTHGKINQSKLLELLDKSIDSLNYLRSDGTLQKALERSELALFQALFDDVEPSSDGSGQNGNFDGVSKCLN